MANEIQIRSGLQIRKGNLLYQSPSQSFSAGMAGSNGPTPGSILVATGGTSVDLSQLATLGGMCRLQNRDATNYVEYGVWNGSHFFPLGELLPGESYVLRLSRNLLYGESGTADVNSLRLRANTSACVVLVEAFDA